jgi:hypothetical protein
MPKNTERKLTMNDKEQIKEVVNNVALFQDMKQWERLENYFVKKPFVDNKAITGEMPAVVPKKRLIDSWRKEIGSYFYATRHFIRKQAVRMLSSRRAKVTTAVENVHYVADRGDRYVWTVNGTWKISQMIFKLQDQAVRPLGAAA